MGRHAASQLSTEAGAAPRATARRRRRAWEVRTAQARAERPVSEGGKTCEPVREVIERTETVVRTVVRPTAAPSSTALRPARRLSGQPYTLPEDAGEWIEALAVLRREVANPKIHPFREYIARACEKTGQQPVLPHRRPDLRHRLGRHHGQAHRDLHLRPLRGTAHHQRRPAALRRCSSSAAGRPASQRWRRPRS